MKNMISILTILLVLFACADSDKRSEAETATSEIDVSREVSRDDLSYLYDLSLEEILTAPPVSIWIIARDEKDDYFGDFSFNSNGTQSFGFRSGLVFNIDHTIYLHDSLTIQYFLKNNHIDPPVTRKLEIVIPKSKVIDAIQGDWGPYEEKMVVLEIAPRFLD